MSERPTLQMLQLELEEHKEAIKDFRTLIELNLEALAVAEEGSAVQLLALFGDIQQQTDSTEKSMFELLVTEQIREEDVQLRRQRMQEYEDRIQQRRRAIADKEGVYHSMTSSKRRNFGRYEDTEKFKQAERHKQNAKYIRVLERNFEDVMLLGSIKKYEHQQLTHKKECLREAGQTSRKLLSFLQEVCQSEQLYQLLGEEQIGAMLSPVTEALQVFSTKPKKGHVCSGTSSLKAALKCMQANQKLLKQYGQEADLTRYLQDENIGLIQRYKQLSAEYRPMEEKTGWRDESTTQV